MDLISQRMLTVPILQNVYLPVWHVVNRQGLENASPGKIRARQSRSTAVTEQSRRLFKNKRIQHLMITMTNSVMMVRTTERVRPTAARSANFCAVTAYAMRMNVRLVALQTKWRARRIAMNTTTRATMTAILISRTHPLPLLMSPMKLDFIRTSRSGIPIRRMRISHS